MEKKLLSFGKLVGCWKDISSEVKLPKQVKIIPGHFKCNHCGKCCADVQTFGVDVGLLDFKFYIEKHPHVLPTITYSVVDGCYFIGMLGQIYKLFKGNVYSESYLDFIKKINPSLESSFEKLDNVNMGYINRVLTQPPDGFPSLIKQCIWYDDLERRCAIHKYTPVTCRKYPLFSKFISDTEHSKMNRMVIPRGAMQGNVKQIARDSSGIACKKSCFRKDNPPVDERMMGKLAKQVLFNGYATNKINSELILHGASKQLKKLIYDYSMKYRQIPNYKLNSDYHDFKLTILEYCMELGKQNW